MKSWLFALGLALCCAVQAEWEAVTREDQVSGTWYNLAVASDSSQMLDQLSHMPVSLADVTRTKENEIIVTISFPMPGGCKKMVTAFRRSEDGKYHGHCGESKVTVEKVMLMGDYAMASVTFRMGDTTFRSLTLHSRTPDQNPEIKQEFIDECEKCGFDNNQIIFLEPGV